MTKAQNIKFLVSLGIPEDKAKKMSGDIPDTATETAADDVEAALTSAVAHQRSIFENDVDYKKKIQDAEIGKQRDIFEKKIIKLSGLTAEDVKDKKLEDIVSLAFDKAGKSKDATGEELQKKLREALDKITKLEEEEIPNIRKQVDNDRLVLKTEGGLMKHIGSLKKVKGADPEDLLLLAKTKAAKRGYQIQSSENGEITFLDSKGAKLMTADGKNFLQPKDVLTELLDGFIEKSNAGDPPAGGGKGKETITVDDDANKNKQKNHRPSVMEQNLEIARKHAESMKKDNDNED